MSLSSRRRSIRRKAQLGTREPNALEDTALARGELVGKGSHNRRPGQKRAGWGYSCAVVVATRIRALRSEKGA